MPLDANNLRYVLLETLPSPEEIFKMVMEYSAESGKDKWKCFAEVFNPYNHTVVLIDKETGNYIGYGMGWMLESDQFFLNHGYVRRFSVINKNRIIDHIAYTVSQKVKIVISKVKMTSDLNPKLWHMWGFTEDKMIAYEKEIE